MGPMNRATEIFGKAQAAARHGLPLGEAAFLLVLLLPLLLVQHNLMPESGVAYDNVNARCYHSPN